MMRRWKQSIRGKLTSVVMLTSATAVLLVCVGFVVSDLVAMRNHLSEDLLMLAEVVGSNSTAALTFEDSKAANEVLNALSAKPSITAACIYTRRGEPFARYAPDASFSLPRVLLQDGFHEQGNGLELFYGIRLDGQRIGTLYIASDARERNERMKYYAAIAAGIVLVSLLIAFVLSSRLQRGISGPIVELARVASLVSRDKSFSTRVTHPALAEGNEIGNLMSGFNTMLSEIEQRDDRLLLNQTQLEETVALRTGELTEANESLLGAKNAAERVAEINAQLARESALILNSATDGIAGLDVAQHLTFLNPAGARILGMTLRDMEGKSIHEAVHHSHPDGTPWPEAECRNMQAIRSGTSVALRADTFWRPDGTSFPVEYSSTPMFREDGRQIGAVMMFRDVTERRAIERLKSEFVSTVSHELRTPLTSIRGALGLLSSGLLGPVVAKGQRMLEIAVGNTDRLIRLINDILDLERIDSGKVELTRGAVDASAVMVQAAEGVQSMADEAGVSLVVVPASGALWGDSDRIIQTLTNLLGNAIKFSPPQTTVTLSGSGGETDFVFCVADQGRGVPENKLKTIFDRFSQVDASDSRDKGGSGLGLAICQSIVTAHKGRIWAEKNDPAGTRFLFTIPLAVSSTVSTSAIDARTIVVSDQCSPGIVKTLEQRGFRVVAATSSDNVISVASRLLPDAIILDMAGGGNCRQILLALRANAATQEVPIVIAVGEFPETYESYSAAVANWAGRPLTSDDLIHALDLACDAPSVLVVEDDLDLARVMMTALQSHGIRTFHAVQGREAIQLCSQFEPSLIVLELILPDMDGFAVVSALRDSTTLSRIPLLVYSALDVGVADQSRLRLGQTEFLTKSRGSLADFEGHVLRLLESFNDRDTRIQGVAPAIQEDTLHAA